MRTLRLQLVSVALFASALAGAPAFGQEKPAKTDKIDKPFNPDKAERKLQQRAAAAGLVAPGDAPAKPPKMSPEDRELERIHELLKCSDDEWVAIRPLVARVNTLQTQLKSSRDRGFKPPKEGQTVKFAKKDKGDGSGGSDGSQSSSQPPVIESFRELRDAMMTPDTSLSELKQRILAARQARAKARAELYQAQEDLRSVTSVHQEATLVLLGLLDY